MNSSAMIYKSNALIEAAYRLSVHEQRIVLSAISQVSRGETVTDEVFYSVSAADISRLSGIAIDDAYGKLRAAALRLKRREVSLTAEPNGLKKPEVMITGWVQTIVYCPGEGRVRLRFSKDMLPYLTELKEQFTKYALSDVAKMDSVYAIRLYELLMQWRSTGQREIALEDFRRVLQLEERYPAIKDFKLRVLDPAVDQINEHSPWSVSWKQRKTGRRVTHLSFTFEPKNKNTKQPKPPKLPKTQAEMAKLALPGESWEQLRMRLQKEAEAAAMKSEDMKQREELEDRGQQRLVG